MNDIIEIINSKNKQILELKNREIELLDKLKSYFENAVILTENYNKLLDKFDQYKLESIKWGIVDFIDLEDDYDITEEQAQIALEDMINSHDCNNGITWDTVQYYKQKYGTEKQ